MRLAKRSARLLPMVAWLLLLGSCGGGGGAAAPTFTIGGSVSGLLASRSVVLANGPTSTATVTGDGTFTFAAAAPNGTSYAVTVATQPSGEVCVVTNGSGSVSGVNVNAVLVTCTPLRYNVGTTVSGLSGTLVLQDNGGDNLSVSSNGAATFAGTVASGSPYAVSVFRQPATQRCSVTNGTGTVVADHVTNITITCLGAAWTWTGGGNVVGAAGRYGTRGVVAASSIPGARQDAGSWRNSIGNVWIFGGTGHDSAGTAGELNDLWSYCECDGVREWLWLSGSNVVNAPGVYGTRGLAAPANTPGARHGGRDWTDVYGNLWLFAGRGYAAAGTQDLLNDLWKFTPSVGTWEWIGGATTTRAAGSYGTRGVPAAGNMPGARQDSQAWTDLDGTDLWLFGGDGLDAAGTQGELNDLWQFSTSNGTWRWVAGASAAGTAGTYGTRGIAAVANQPGARHGATTWSDAAGDLWLFGGVGVDAAGTQGNLNDLWRYSPGSGLWTWVAGANQVETAGTYGVLGTPAGGNAPGARQGASGWLGAGGRFWVFGGTGRDTSGGLGRLNDLWSFDTANATWTWVGGSSALGASGSYGALGLVAAGNAPGARAYAVSWLDPAGTLWMFGGDGAAAGASGNLNDLWVYTP